MRPATLFPAVALVGLLMHPLPAAAQAPVRTFIPEGPSPPQTFGVSAAYDGQTLLLGDDATNAAGFQGSGTVYVFERRDGLWLKRGTLVPSDFFHGISYGRAMAVQGDRMLIGAPDGRGAVPQGGAAYLFERIDGLWTDLGKILPTDIPTGEGFGGWLDLDGDIAAIGTERGAAYVLERSSTGVWSMELLDVVREPNFNITDVSVSGQRIAVGRWNRGVRIFRRDGARWLFEGEIAVPGLMGISFRDPYILATTDRKAIFLERGHRSWRTAATFDAPAGDETSFGTGRSLDWPWAVVGGARRAYLYVHDGRTWRFERTVVPPTPGVSYSDGNQLAVVKNELVYGDRGVRTAWLYDLGFAATGVDLPGETAHSVAPNPFAAETRVLGRTDAHRAELFDALGRHVADLESDGDAWRIDGVNLAPGPYFVVVTGPGGRRTVPLVRAAR